MVEDNGSPRGRIRRLVNNERKFLWSPSGNVAVVGRVRGDLPQKALKEALRRIPEKHPLLASRVEQDGDRALWFVHDPEIEIPLRVVERESDEHWIGEVGREVRTPWDQFRGPLIRFVLVYSPAVSEVMAFSQHAICDGTALAFLIRDVLSLVADPEQKLQRLVPDFTLTEVLGDEAFGGGMGSRIKNFVVNRYNKQWRKNPVYVDHDDYLAIQRAYADKFEYGCVLLELDEPQTRALTGACREHGVTVNTALTAALAAAFQEFYGGGREEARRMALPFDLRRRTDPPLGDVFCLMVGSVEVAFRYRSARSFWENARELHRSIVDKIEGRAVFEAAVMMELLDPTLVDVIVSFSLLAGDVPEGSPRYGKMSRFAGDRRSIANSIADRFLKSLPSIINTNLGRLGFPVEYGGLELETMYFAPAGSTHIPLIVGALGVAGGMTATFNYLKPRGSDDAKRVEIFRVRDIAYKYLDVRGPRASPG
jgi:NRPS condensation-like uncharacterized protein